MTPTKVVAGFVAAGALAGGGSLAADNMINPYQTVGSQLEISADSAIPEAGTDTAAIDTTQPKITLSKFNGELNMGVTYQGMDPNTTGARPFLSKNVEWSDGDQTMQVIPLEASSTFEDGGYEINIILNSEPASNEFNFSIDNADQLDFFYQAPLWQEEGLKALTPDCTDTDCTTSDGVEHRHDNVVGSYAVYYKNHANHIEGQTNYATGRAYQIFRPLVTDANGATTWANLSYANGILTVTVPQSFLDNAEYPVTIDPTFGYTTQGASELTGGATDRGEMVNPHTASSGDTITLYEFYGRNGGGTGTLDFATYSISGGVPVTRLDTPTTVTAASNVSQWWTSGVLSVSMTNAVVYDVAFGNFGPTTDINFDAGTPATSLGSAGALPSTWSQTSTTGNLYSAYATYTAGGGGGGSTPAPNVNTIFYQ